MKLNDKRIGVALSGSFCTYDKVFKELQKLVDEGAKVRQSFQMHLRRLTVVLERRRSLYKRQKTQPNQTDAHNCRGRTNRTKGAFRSFDYPSVYRQHNRKACKWNYGYTGSDGSKGTS